MSLNDNPLGEYAPAPRRRVSRARKALIATMAIGAFAATSGAGTFASFTASTDNPGGALGDGTNPFQTGNFELANTVTDNAGVVLGGGLNPCRSSDDGGLNEGTEIVANASLCDVLFTGNIVDGLEAFVTIENTGEEDGQLVFFRTTACAEDGTAGTSGSNCGDILLTVQEYFDDANGTGPGEGTAVPSYATASHQRADCVFGLVEAGDPGPGDDVAANADSDTQSACTLGRPLSSLPDFANRVEIATTLPAADIDNGNTNHDVRYFRLTAELPADAVLCPGGQTTFNPTTGVGCHNSAMDESASIQLRWMLIG